MDVKIQVDMAPVSRAFGGINDKVRRVLRGGLRTAAKPVVAAARAALAPHRRTGSLAASIGTVIRQYPNTTLVVIGPRAEYQSAAIRKARARGMAIEPGNYAHLVEDGTAPHVIRQRVHPGAQAVHYMSDAIEVTHQAAQERVIRDLSYALQGGAK